MIKQKRMEEICSRFKEKKILVCGDVILDRYIFGSVDRISPEAPVPVVKIQKEEYRIGGAGNVAANIDKLGGRSIILGIVGNDSFSDEIFKIKSCDNRIIKSPVNQTLVKTRVISQRQQIVRIDREEPITITHEIEAQIRSIIQSLTRNDVDGIIVSDYAKGTLTPQVMEALKEKSRSLRVPLVVDPKPPNYHLYRDIDGITPNLKEAESILRKKIEDDTQAGKAVNFIRRKFKSKFALVTRGDKGISAGEHGKKVFHIPAYSHEVFDVTGAGDTVIAVLILALTSSASLREAVTLANGAASIVVEKIGTSQVTIDELLGRLNYLTEFGYKQLLTVDTRNDKL